MQWSDVLTDQSLQDLPYKIELNEYGHIEMSPASNKHGLLQSRVDKFLGHHLPMGETITECAIQTLRGVKVADVVWCSPQFFDQQDIEQSPFTRAPDICVEILSPSNTEREMQEKIQLYLQQGAQEVWLVSLTGVVAIFDSNGERQTSHFIKFPLTSLDDRKA